MDSELASTEFRKQLSESIDRYRDNDIFVCLFCSVEDHDPVQLLLHLFTVHKFVLTRVGHIPLLPKYLEYWKTHTPPIINAQFLDTNTNN
jgi:hypothetical protein